MTSICKSGLIAAACVALALPGQECLCPLGETAAGLHAVRADRPDVYRHGRKHVVLLSVVL